MSLPAGLNMAALLAFFAGIVAVYLYHKIKG